MIPLEQAKTEQPGEEEEGARGCQDAYDGSYSFGLEQAVSENTGNLKESNF